MPAYGVSFTVVSEAYVVSLSKCSTKVQFLGMGGTECGSIVYEVFGAGLALLLAPQVYHRSDVALTRTVLLCFVGGATMNE